MAERPTGAVTFLFTDVEGSTQAWEQKPEEMDQALEIHDRTLREAIESNGGYVFATGGDSFSAAFTSPTNALTAAVESQRGLVDSGCALQVRMGVHSGEAVERDGNYFGPALNRTARLMSIGHGGQILVSTTTRELVTSRDYEFVDLGEHRLADLSTPSHIVQLLADGLRRDFPALRSVVPTDNLPTIREVFGRDSDIEQVTRLLADHRLVTLTGAGGIGKTTLATSVATQMVDPFPDGRWLVDLTDLPRGSERTAILGAVAGVDNRFGSLEALVPRQMLLVLDNCEHVLDGVRSYVSDVLDTAPKVTVLATSREPIGTQAEWAIPVQPLSVDKDSAHASAVDLFVERAARTGVDLDDADRDTITLICREVGGLPLAIELAAARSAVMTPSQILNRLGDRLSILRGGREGPDHHRTIEATIAWSYDLLDEDTKKLLRFLSVFEGGFDLEQAETVGGEGAIDRLADLVRKSLVQRVDHRFGMLEAVRQYAATRLAEGGEDDDARRIHSEFFARWAHHIYHRSDRIELTDPERHWITENLANLHGAVRDRTDRNDFGPAAEIAAVLWPHWVDVLYFRNDHEDWFAPLLPHLDRLDPQLQMAILHGSGSIAVARNDWDRGEELLRAELDIHRRTELLPKGSIAPQNNLAAIAINQGNWDEGEKLLREGIESQKKQNRSIEVESGNLSSIVGWVRGNFSEALDIIRDARALDHLNTDVQIASLSLAEANCLIELGRYADAEALIKEALSSLRHKSVRLTEQVWALEDLAKIALARGDVPMASSLLLEAIDILTVEDMTPLWRRPGAYVLAETLIDGGAFQTANRVLSEFKRNPSRGRERAPVVLQRAQEQEARLPNTHKSIATEQPLIDAVRQALEAVAR